jgi:hypothetical protein
MTTHEPVTELNGRKIAFPEVHTFGELFTDCRPAAGESPIVKTWPSWEAGTWSDRAGRSRSHLYGWLSVHASDNLGGWRSFHVSPSPTVVGWIGANMLHGKNDRKHFEIHVWDDGRALVTCQYGQIIGSAYLAVIDAATVPAKVEPPSPSPAAEPTDEKARNRAEQQRRRAKYLAAADQLGAHDAYYRWLSDFVGLTDDLIPFTAAEVAASTDPHLNDLPLRRWDARHSVVLSYIRRKKLPWSLCDTVCCLKAMARRRAGR